MTTHRSTDALDRVYEAMLKLQAEQLPRGVPLKEIAEEAGLTHKGTVSNYIKRLVSEGLVKDMGGGRGRYRAITYSELAGTNLTRAKAESIHKAQSMTYSDMLELAKDAASE